MHTDLHKPSLLLLSSICYPETCQFSVYGCQHEKHAVKAYKLKLQSGTHDQPMVTPCGFVVLTHKPLFGASPDAFVECNCCGRGVLEVKCPFCVRSSAVLDLPNICPKKDEGGSLHLKRDHAYYYQCQLQLFATERLYCDFVVWTEANLHIERIIKDKLFLKEIIPRAEKFFKSCVLLPELFGKWFTGSHGCQVPCYDDPEVEEDSGTWCTASCLKGGDMVCCENNIAALNGFIWNACRW